MIVFDVETGPLDTATILSRVPAYEPPTHPGAFDPSAVKLGRMVDQGKIAAKIAEAELAHAQAVANYDQAVTDGREQYLAEVVERAPLSPLTGCVLAVGLRFDNGQSQIVTGDEADVLEAWWHTTCTTQGAIVGFNSHAFDLPFLMRRSWLLGVHVPATIRQGRYWSSRFIDLRELWQCGTFGGKEANGVSQSLDSIGQAMGLGGKAEGCTGAEWHKLYHGDALQRAAAIAYLERDLELTRAVAERMGVI